MGNVEGIISGEENIVLDQISYESVADSHIKKFNHKQKVR